MVANVGLGRFQGARGPVEHRPDSKPTFTRGDLIRLHGEAYYLRGLVEEQGPRTVGTFTAYDALGILPTHVHRGKGAHTRALLLLVQGLRNARREPADPRSDRL